MAGKRRLLTPGVGVGTTVGTRSPPMLWVPFFVSFLTEKMPYLACMALRVCSCTCMLIKTCNLSCQKKVCEA